MLYDINQNSEAIIEIAAQVDFISEGKVENLNRNIVREIPVNNINLFGSINGNFYLVR